MKIKIAEDIYVESRTLIRIEWRKYFPVLIIHEKFEKKVKWIIRIIAFIGIGISIFSFDKWYCSLSVSIIISLIEQFFEKTVFEYTTFVIEPLPDFEIDCSQWKQNSFRVPMSNNNNNLCYVGPAYADKDYAINFFNYLKSWNWGHNIDKENNIVLSFVIEPNEKYTTYLYANTGRKNIKKIFEQTEGKNKLKKYGKKQQQFVWKKIYWYTLPFIDGYFIKRFLEFQKNDQKFYLVPSVIPKQNGQKTEFLFDHAILKFGYKLKSRNKLSKHDIEYYYPPMNKNKK